MLEGLEGVTTAALGLALDAASLRQQAIAANIANANALDFIPLEVNFEEQIEDARQALQSKGRIDPFALGGVHLRLQQVQEDALAVRLDVEAAKLAQNTVQYQALVKAIGKHFAILESAMGESRK